ncbi:SLC13 family permease [Fructobacillus evanidus]|uniref:Na+/H+ antiporter NhaD or related arsenite permease (ArsB) n=1 Tax=Fructobacillus evanidus TaxID=3064281 RepID=A0ABM9MVI4_9LACO|nr:Na+/H+ antiporter NhaD or related arsenite permease (ArsB) [Fructobacillus sp. LMG 32999]CAK1231034.1 Na+/H+ antiporter NhaD or related arsenite permease (ArsB) [Fructobacillus sp. LMG 32999]CAK1233788.1 Na+/H+ antiporter NhaD or related arsenite permease (ArsB) [Fructobacillus sp. LMG 32999]CAK1233964.1 Na+/H+ antiporter NhaD or related arsenite permease (ArsB) [Fructobacillus sp. LMG 32999]CAK1235078.1 Na+/H+ antiporter NhaD or related arsenite permease (ArsB) [Fructobacillus sp. LMG 32999
MTTIFKKLTNDYFLILTTVIVCLLAISHQLSWQSLNFPTLFSLAALLVLVSTWSQLGLLDYFAQAILARAKTNRQAVLFLLLIAFFGSMFVTNDVTILTLIPLFFVIVRQIDLPIARTVTFITIYANLGSAASPFGNPQNLYLLSYYHWSLNHFLPTAALLLTGLITLPLGLIGLNQEPLPQQDQPTLPIKKGTLTWLVLGTLAVLSSLLGLIPAFFGLIIALILAITIDRQSLTTVDYGVVWLIANFFLIVGALIRLPQLATFLKWAGQSFWQTFITGALVSQGLSNVPTVALLAPFTSYKVALFLGVSVGGFGTLVASLANLLAYRQVRHLLTRQDARRFFIVFTGWNLLFLLGSIALVWPFRQF